MGKKSRVEEQSKHNGKSEAMASGSKAQFDPKLDSLFSSSLGPVSKPTEWNTPRSSSRSVNDLPEEQDDEDLSFIDSAIDSSADNERNDVGESAMVENITGDVTVPRPGTDEPDEAQQKRRERKRKRQDDQLEEKYMARLALSEEKELAKLQERRHNKMQKTSSGLQKDEDTTSSDVNQESEAEDQAEMSPPPQHETISGDDLGVEKAARTVFLANVSTEAITSKTGRKTLLAHLASHLEALGSAHPTHKVESLRFRSTAFASAIPKRAAFAKGELMEATTKATNAYAVYSTREAARAASKQLNGTVVLERHLRVDEVAHPAKTDHKRCVFVGNLGFVDDESVMQANEATEDASQKKRSKQKVPSDVEEGLWREFSKVGTVESVRVVRDAKTRVGKGFAYVQFIDENAVEAALLLNEKKFPPMLPRKLRVTRAKAVKRNATKRGGPPPSLKSTGTYAPRMSSQQQSLRGRANRLLGKAGASQMNGKGTPGRPSTDRPKLGNGIKPPEAFVFEGHRATSGQKPKFKTKKAKGGKPQTRSSRRGAAWKSAGGNK